MITLAYKYPAYNLAHPCFYFKNKRKGRKDAMLLIMVQEEEII